MLHKFRTRIHSVPVAAVLLVAPALLAGCSAGDPYGVSSRDWETPMARADRRTAEHQPPVQAGKLATTTSLPEMTAGQTLTLSPEQAVLMALRYNRSLAVEQYEPAVAGEFERIAQTIYDPTVFAEVAYSEGQRREVSRATGTAFNTETEGLDVIAGVDVELPTGTAVELAASESRTISNRTPDQHEARVGLTLTQALLQGVSVDANLASIRQAQLDVIASEHELRGFALELIAEVELTYWETALAAEEIRIFERGLEVAKQLADETRQRIEVGVLPDSEIATAEAEVALRRQDLIDARSRYESARLRLLRLINPRAEDVWSIPVDIPLPQEPPPLPAEGVGAHMKLARLYRPDVSEARVRLDQERLEVVQTRHGLLPVLDLFLTIGKSGYADAFADAVRDMDGPSYDLTAGLRFEHSLGNEAAKARDRQALLSRAQAAAAVENLAQLAELDVQLAFVELNRAWQQIEASAATLRLREQALARESERLRVGKSTNLLVAQASRDLLESRVAQAAAIVNVKRALIELYRLDGTLLQRRGIAAPGGVAR